jgi:hypothetical protein
MRSTSFHLSQSFHKHLIHWIDADEAARGNSQSRSTYSAMLTVSPKITVETQSMTVGVDIV